LDLIQTAVQHIQSFCLGSRSGVDVKVQDVKTIKSETKAASFATLSLARFITKDAVAGGSG